MSILKCFIFLKQGCIQVIVCGAEEEYNFNATTMRQSSNTITSPFALLFSCFLSFPAYSSCRCRQLSRNDTLYKNTRIRDYT